MAPFIGFVGLVYVDFPAAFTPCVEIGWRLGREHWGKGYASEAARASTRYGFEQIGLEEVVSFTVPHNLRSRAVMERIGMTRSPEEDFDHPVLPEGHPLSPAWGIARDFRSRKFWKYDGLTVGERSEGIGFGGGV